MVPTLIRVCADRRLMRPSRVPVLSFDRHDLVYDPGGLRHASPYRRRRILRSSTMKLSAVGLWKRSGTRSSAYPLRDHNFRGSIQTLSTRFTRLLTFVSASQRVSLLGCWLGFAHGRIFTSWITSTDFIEEAILEFQQLRVYLGATSSCHRWRSCDANRPHRP